MKKEFMNKGMLQSKRKATGFNWERFDFNSKILINPSRTRAKQKLTNHENHPTGVGMPREGVDIQLVLEFHYQSNNCRE